MKLLEQFLVRMISKDQRSDDGGWRTVPRRLESPGITAVERGLAMVIHPQDPKAPLRFRLTGRGRDLAEKLAPDEAPPPWERALIEALGSLSAGTRDMEQAIRRREDLARHHSWMVRSFKRYLEAAKAAKLKSSP